MSNNKSCKTLYECVEDYSIRMFYLTCQAFGRLQDNFLKTS